MAGTCKAFTRLSTGIDLNVWPSALWHFGTLAAPLNHKYWPHWCNAACLLCVSHICHDLIFTRFSIGSHQVFSESQYWLRFSPKVSSSFQKFATIRNPYWPVSYCIVLVLDSNNAEPLAFRSSCWSLFLLWCHTSEDIITENHKAASRGKINHHGL